MVGHNRTLLRSELGVTEATLKQQGNQKNTPPRSVRLIFDISGFVRPSFGERALFEPMRAKC